MIKEIWKPSVRDGYWISSRGRVWSDISGRVLKPYLNEGYYQIKLGGTKVWKIHRLVCLAFHGNPPLGKSQVNHKDCITTNNWPSNLEWVSAKENGKHAFLNGRINSPVGEHSVNAKYSNKLVELVREQDFSTRGSMKKFANQIDMPLPMVSMIYNYKERKHG